MKICFTPAKFHYYKPQNIGYQKTKPIPFDCISFGAMKKSEFEGIDLAVINKFKAPIEKFETDEDFQNWALNKTYEIISSDFTGRDKNTGIYREEILENWYENLLFEENKSTGALILLVLNDITKNLKSNNDTLPPAYSKKVLQDTINKMRALLKENNKEQINFDKLYKENLRKYYFEGEQKIDSDFTGWIIILSQKNDPLNFEDNVAKLKAISHDTWCTKSYSAQEYLSEGDFHIYLKEGSAKIGIRFNKNKVEEIQGEENNSTIPIKYLEVIQNHIKGIDKTLKVKQDILEAVIKEKKIKKLKSKIAPLNFYDLTTYKLLTFFGIKIDVLKNGKLSISQYRQPSNDISFSDLGVDENKLLSDIEEIKGNAVFDSSNATSLGSVRVIGGNVWFWKSKITDLGELESIGKNADFKESQIKSLKHLKSIEGSAFFSFSNVEDLGELETIGNVGTFVHSKIHDLKNLKHINHGVRCDEDLKEMFKEKIKDVRFTF